MEHDPSIPKTNFVIDEPERRGHRQTLVIATVFVVVLAGIAALGASASYRAVRSGSNVFFEITRLPVITDIRRLVSGDTNNDVLVTPDHRINFLLLGIGGDGHDGGQLSDTLIIASFDTERQRVGLLSIPRDLAYPLSNGAFEKINALNAKMEDLHPGEGARYAADAIGKLLDTRIDHVIRIDFKGFSKFVDAIGGVDVAVEHSFTDYQYPTADEKWQTVSFKKGVEHMSGSRALIFARSRHGNNNEGSDFARSRRQQLVMMAVREKLLSLGTLSNPKKIADVYASISNHVQSDLTPWDAIKLASLASGLSRDRITMKGLSDAPDGGLVDSGVNGNYILYPRVRDWSEVRELVKVALSAPAPVATSTTRLATSTSTRLTARTPVTPTPPLESAKIEVKNGTTRTGFASQISAMLEKSGFEIMSFGNAVRRGNDRTTIIDLTNGAKPEALARLQKTLKADISKTIPAWIQPDTATNTRAVYVDGLAKERIFYQATDFLVILGEGSFGLLNP